MRVSLLVFTSAVSLLLVEFALRFVLFSPHMNKTSVAQRFRKAQLYAPHSSRSYYKLYTEGV